MNIIALCDTLPNKRAVWVIADQLIRCSCSIGANLVEARV
ncbi:MAG: four helix bundle protein [Candidatus Doudnabacteria bacterium]|nr:four helix bundle protein [Candidatus Doudnabacteria bacterium]